MQSKATARIATSGHTVRRVYSRNADFQLLHSLLDNRQQRNRQGVFLVEGVRNINAAMERDWTVRALLYAPERTLSQWAQERIASTPVEIHYHLSPELLAELSGKDEVSELLALVEMRRLTVPELPTTESPLYCLFDRPSNRGNLGTIIRSCDALGIDALAITGHGVDPYDPETVGASMGSFFALPLAQVNSAAEFDGWVATLRTRYAGFQVVGTSAHGVADIDAIDLGLPTLLLVGNESDGLSHRLATACDILARIPMAQGTGASSLNVAAAATVLFYEAARQRKPVT